MEYKMSRFVACIMDENKDYVMLNTRTYALAKVRNSYSEKLFKSIKEKTYDVEDERIQYLIKNQFLIDEEFDEERFCEKLYIEQCHSNKALVITIMPTEGCNFRCEYCYEQHTPGFMSQEVQDKIVKYVKKNLKNYGALTINWFGGEPLLGLDIMEYLTGKFKEICKEYKKPYTAAITTNGYLLTLDTYNKLKRMNVRDYQITVDGFAETHDTQRFLADGKGTWDTIINNLRAIRDNDHSSILSMTIRTNVTKKMLPRHEEFVKFMKEEFGHDNRFTFRNRAVWNGSNKEGYDEQLIDQASMTDISADSIKEDISKKDLTIKDVENQMYEMLYSFHACYAGYSNCVVINPLGKVLKCTANLYNENSIVGEVLSNGTIGYNHYYLEWVTRTTDKEYREKCYQCPIYPSCLGVNCPDKMIREETRNTTCEAMRVQLYRAILPYSVNENICKVLED